MDQFKITLYGTFKQHQIEKTFINSFYCGIWFLPIVSLIHIMLRPEAIIIAPHLIAILLFALNKYRYRWITRAILIMTQFRIIPQQAIDPFCTLLINQVLIPNFPLQIVLAAINVRSFYQFLLLIWFLLVSRCLEIKKRQLFLLEHKIFKEEQENKSIIQSLPAIMLIFDENLICQQSIGVVGQNLKQLFDNNSIKVIVEATKRKRTSFLILRIQNKLPMEFLFKYEDNHFQLIQSQFKAGDCSIMDSIHQQSDHIFHILCQDYQKWNNLRAFKVIKEQDLNILAQCTSEAQEVKTHFYTLLNLLQDLNFSQQPKQVEFNIRHYLQVVVETFANKLFDHVTSINLQFEEAIPEYLAGDKTTLLFIFNAILFCICLDQKKLPPKISSKTKIEERDLIIKVNIDKVNNEIQGYDLEYQFIFPHTQYLYSLLECSQGKLMPSSISESEQMVLYMLKKCNILFDQENKPISIKMENDKIIIEFVMVVMLCRQRIQQDMAATLQEYKGDNIIYPDLSQTKVSINSNHCLWKRKIQNGRSSVLQPQLVNEQQNIEEAETAVEESLDQVEEIKPPPLKFPDLKDDIVKIFEEIIQQLHNEGLIDKDVVYIEQKDEYNVQEYSFQEKPAEKQQLIKQFASPQPQPRRLPNNFRKDKLSGFIIKPEVVKQTRDYTKKPILYPFSPNIMNKFRSLNPISTQSKIIPKIRPSILDLPLIISSKNITESGENSKNCSLSHQQVFPTQIFKNRSTPLQKLWTHKIPQVQQLDVVNETLCYIPNTTWKDFIIKFSTTVQHEKDRSCQPYIVYNMYHLVKIYKQYLQEGKQFFFIMICLLKPNEIIDTINIIRKIELQQDLKKQVFIIGWQKIIQNTSQLLLSNFNYTMQIYPDDQNDQMKSYKVQIVKMIENQY